jgi:Right handed beta helix region
VAAAVLALVACGDSNTDGTVYEIRPGDDLAGRLKQLEAGDEVVVHAGTYRSGFLSVEWRGRVGAPIVVRGAAGEPRPVIVGPPDQNVLVVRGEWFRLAHLELRGGDDGVRLGDARDASLDDLVIHDVGDVGISCNFPDTTCDRVTIRDSTIYDTGHEHFGEGIYLGCADRSCTFRNGLVERNRLHDLGGRQGDGIELKPGSWGNTVRGNVVRAEKGPAIWVRGPATPGRPLNVIERNRVSHPGGLGIVLEARAIARGNVGPTVRRPP